MFSPLCALFFTQLLVCHSHIFTPFVNTSIGIFNGYVNGTEDGVAACIFKGIPYASAPIKNLRWRLPQKLTKYSNRIRSARKFKPACAQKAKLSRETESGFSEDCLYINVYSSTKCIKETCPYVFYIHGGSLLFDHPMVFPDDAIIDTFTRRDIVFITTTYRLNIFGTLTLEDEGIVPSNLAYHDVLTALEFVNDNARAFGGDSKQLTVMGHSSGGGMATIVAMMPSVARYRKPPIHGLIAMSDLTIFDTRSKREAISREWARKAGVLSAGNQIYSPIRYTLENQFASSRNKFSFLSAVERGIVLYIWEGHDCVTDFQCIGSGNQIMACLRRKSTGYLLNSVGIKAAANYSINTALTGELFQFGNIRDLRRFPTTFRTMVGTTVLEMEFSSKRDHGPPEHINNVTGIQNEPEILEKYWQDYQEGRANFNRSTLSTAIYTSSAMTAREEARKGNEVFVYSYDYPKHAMHTDDLFYLLGYKEFEMDRNEKVLKGIYQKCFTNFIKGLPPDEYWKTFTSEKSEYFSINYTRHFPFKRPRTRTGYRLEMVNYWADEMVLYDESVTVMKTLFVQSKMN